MIEAGTQNNAIELSLRRHKFGIKVQVRVWPEIEAFFERWSGGATERPAHGRIWAPVNKGDQLTLWVANLPNLMPGPTRPYSIMHSGIGFTTEQGHPNISFIRLVGASGSDGREVILEAPIGLSELKVASQRLSDASEQFYTEFLRPVNIKAFVGVHMLPAEREAAQAA